MAITNIQIQRKGVITLPIELRRRYDLNEGDVFTLVDLCEGSLLLVPHVSQITRLGDNVARALKERNVSLDEMLRTLDEEREHYYQEHYVED